MHLVFLQRKRPQRVGVVIGWGFWQNGCVRNLLRYSGIIVLLAGLALFAARGGEERGGGGIVLVRGTGSLPNDSERNYADTVTRHLSRWLGELGLRHRIVPDEAIDAAALSRASLVVLGYNSQLLPGELTAIRGYVARGGHVLVFYSADARLAQMLGFRLGDYRPAPAQGYWAAIRFRDAGTTGLPLVVRQNSRNIRPVYPAAASAEVLATWESASGRATGDPAWVRSGRGAWMTHVLLDDGDTTAKKQMLLGILALYDDAVLRRAAVTMLRTCGRLGSFEDYPEAFRAVRRRELEVKGKTSKRLAAIGKLHGRMRNLHGEGRYVDVMKEGRRLREQLTSAYARAQEGRTGELRGVWEHAGTGLYPGDWSRTCRVLKANGMTDLFSNMLWAGRAHYASDIVPRSSVYARYGDQLEACLRAGHEAGLRVHAWKVCWNLAGAPERLVSRLRGEGRLQVTDAGTQTTWLCPSNAENRRMELDAVAELVRRYRVDGVHLDYIRYPDSRSCYCTACRRGFERACGRAVVDWPGAVREAPLLGEYRRWRCAQITSFVGEVRRVIDEIRPGVQLSAAVYGKYPACRASVAQDWPAWLRSGAVDFVCPMNYVKELDRFTELASAQLALPGARGRVLCGIGVTTTSSRLDAIEVIDQVVVTRDSGAAGFILFDLNRIVEADILPALRLGITAE